MAPTLLSINKDDQETHQTGLETEDSFIPLSTGDTKGQSTLPSSEDVEVTAQDQEGTLVTEEVKVSEKPKVARQPVELYQHEGSKVSQIVHLVMYP